MNSSSPFSILKRNPVILAALVLVAGIAIGVVAGYGLGGGDGSETDGTEVTQRSLEDAVAGLCETRRLAADGNLGDARNVFLNEAHLFLHLLATEALPLDSQATTEMLQAKYAVESLLSLPAGGGATTQAEEGGTGASEDGSPAQLVDNLIVQVQRTAEVIGLEAPGC